MFNKSTPENKPMQTNSTSAPASASSVNIIGQGTSIDGEIVCDGDIRIDGMVKGTVTSKAKIVIGATGSVDGDIICDNADISGKIFGTVEVDEMLFLKATSYIEGNITTGKLIVETGAKFNGTCRMGVKEIKPNEKHNPQQQQDLQKKAV